MNGHVGGEAHSRYLMELSFLPAGARVLDMGAGDGQTVRLLRTLGYEAEGIDLNPAQDVTSGDYLHAPYADESFDGIISECSFYAGGDVPLALKKAESWHFLMCAAMLWPYWAMFAQQVLPADILKTSARNGKPII